jgi:hypothetical protein
MQRTGEERLIMGYAMWDTAKVFVEASLRTQNLYDTKRDIRKVHFLRFYGHEFDAQTRDKILPAIDYAASQRNHGT